MHPVSFTRTPLNLPLLLFLGLILFQLIPLPPSALKLLSPNTYAIYKQTVPGYDTSFPHSAFRTPHSNDSAFRIPHSTDSSIQNPKSKIQNPDSLPIPNSEFRTPHSLRPLSIYPHATRAELFKYIAYIGVFFLIINTVKTRAQIRQLILAIILAGTFLALLGIMQMAAGTDKIYWFWQSHYKARGYFGPYVNPNHFAGYMEMVIPLAIGLLLSRRSPGASHQEKSWRYRLSAFDEWFSKNALLVFVTVLMVASLCFSLSRGGIITLLFSVILFLSLLLFTRHKRRRSANVLLSVLLVSLIFLVWLGIDPVLKELATLSELDKASLGRTTVWSDTVRLAKDYPLFGAGLGNFQNLYPKFRTIESKRFYLHAENDYLETLADTGSIGVLFFFGGVCFFLIMMVRKWLERREPFVRGITLGGIVGAAAILFHSLVDFNLHIPANALLFFIILGLIAAAVHLKIRQSEEYSVLPTRVPTLRRTTRLVLYPLTLLLFLAFATTIIRTCIASFHFQDYRDSQNEKMHDTVSRIQASKDEFQNPKSKIQNPKDLLLSALALDPGNAAYHFGLGQYYARRMAGSWKESQWKLYRGKWYVDFKKETIDSGLRALDSFYRSIELQPTNGWYQLHLGWILQQLSQLSSMMPPDSQRSPHDPTISRLLVHSAIRIPQSAFERLSTLAPTYYYTLALTLDPTNPYIKDAVEKWQEKTVHK